MEETKLRLSLVQRYRQRCVPVLICILFVLLNLDVRASTIKAYVFVSFSMPPRLLEQVLTDASRHHIPVVLNGLVNNSMNLTIKKITALANSNPDISLQIDPLLFERFNIRQVPSMVVTKGDEFDVIRGNMTIEGLFDHIKRKGDTQLSLPAWRSH